MPALFRYQQFHDPSLGQIANKTIGWTDGEATFDVLAGQLRSGELSPSMDLVFSDEAFRPFNEAREFLEACEGVVDRKQRRATARRVTGAVLSLVVLLALAAAAFLARLSLR